MGVGIGAACRDRTVAFVSTFAAFFTRAFDQLRMGAISQVSSDLSTFLHNFVCAFCICNNQLLGIKVTGNGSRSFIICSDVVKLCATIKYFSETLRKMHPCSLHDINDGKQSKGDKAALSFMSLHSSEVW